MLYIHIGIKIKDGKDILIMIIIFIKISLI